jgi:hypothetical protein
MVIMPIEPCNHAASPRTIILDRFFAAHPRCPDDSDASYAERLYREAAAEGLGIFPDEWFRLMHAS